MPKHMQHSVPTCSENECVMFTHSFVFTLVFTTHPKIPIVEIKRITHNLSVCDLFFLLHSFIQFMYYCCFYVLLNTRLNIRDLDFISHRAKVQ